MSYKKEKNRYVFQSVTRDGEVKKYVASNFTMTNPHLIKGQEPQRLIEAINEFGEQINFSITAADFASVSKFKGLIEGFGNFLWFAGSTEFLQVKAELFKEAKSAEELPYLGWHEKHNLYAFANGVVSPGEDFNGINDNGFASLKNECFYLPFMVGDNAGNLTYANFQKFRHETRKGVSFSDWAKQFYHVFGRNSVVGILYLITAINRDIISNHLRFFPHLFLFGPPQSGKSAFSEALQYIFGQPQTPINLEAGSTAVGAFRKLEQVSNSITAINEYKNSIDPKLIGMLKSLYDLQGRETGAFSNDSRTKTSSIRSASVIAGQDLPSNDPALFSRVIPLNFSKPNSYTNEEKKRFGDLAEYSHLGLTDVLLEILAVRENFKSKFIEKHNSWLKKLKNRKSQTIAMERTYLHSAILGATYEIYKEYLSFPFDDAEFEAVLYENLDRHIEDLATSTDVSNFWEVFEVLISKSLVIYDKHYSVKIEQNSANEKTKKLEINWKLLYPEYRDFMIRQRKPPLNDKTMLSYLKNTEAYLEYKKVRFAYSTPWAFVFDMEKLNLDLKTNEI